MGIRFVLALLSVSQFTFSEPAYAQCERPSQQNPLSDFIKYCDEGTQKSEFLKKCGHAPVRLFNPGQIKIKLNKVYPNTIKLQSSHLIHTPSSKMLIGHFLKKELPTNNGIKYRAIQVASHKPNVKKSDLQNELSYQLLHEHVLEISNSTGVKSDVAESYSFTSGRSEERPDKSIHLTNKDISLNDFILELEPFFSVSLDSPECPLSTVDQGDYCELKKTPYDYSRVNPHEKTNLLIADAKKRIQSGAIFSLSEKIEDSILFKSQNNSGFAYAIQYETNAGELIPEKLVDQYSNNPFFIKNLITTTPCKNWKIKKLLLNFHNSRTPYAYSLVSTQKDSDNRLIEIINSDDLYGTFNSQHIRSKLTGKMSSVYAKGSQVTINSCFSFDRNGIATILSGLDPGDNPIRLINGIEGTCYTWGGSATSSTIPSWLTLSSENISKINNDYLKNCPKSKTLSQARACYSHGELSGGGIYSILCDTGSDLGCCYKKVNGSTQSGFVLDNECINPRD